MTSSTMAQATNSIEYLEGSLMPHAKFLSKSYVLAQSRYRWVGQFTKNKVVLDAGCGSGYGAARLASGGARKVYGIDISAKAIDYCRASYHQNNLNFTEGDITKLNFPDCFFDTIVAFEVIEHIKEYPKVIGEFYRLLKPSGRLVISTPNKLLYSPGTNKPFYPFHWREFYLDDLKYALRRFNLQDIWGQYIKGQEKAPYPAWHPERNVRIIFANLPRALKLTVVRLYLKIFFWLARNGIHRPRTLKLSDAYLSRDLDGALAFVAVCQKPYKKI